VRDTAASPALQPPPGNPRFPLFDGIRALAILLVLFCHSAEISGATATASWGWLALGTIISVFLFFGVSGFLLYRPYASAHAGLRPAPRTRSYLRRRALRILPGYWVALTLLAIWPGIDGPFSGKWWVYYGFAQVYSNGTKGGGDPVAWSLATEVSFYLLLPLLAWLVARLARSRTRGPWWLSELWLLLPLGLSGFVIAALAGRHLVPTWLGTTLAGTGTWFAVGMGLAVASVELERRGGRRRWAEFVRARSGLVWAAAAVLFVVASRWLDVNREFERNPATHAPAFGIGIAHGLAFAMVVALVLLPAAVGGRGVVRALLASRPFVWLGVITYGMFLWHFPLMFWLASWHGPPDPIPGMHGGLALQQHLPGPDTLVLFVAVLAVTVPVAALSYRLVELPFLRFKERRLWTAWRPAALPLLRRRLTWASTSARR
jgi:peptidoglycan/LPS O-acetylase OafA/YrhL